MVYGEILREKGHRLNVTKVTFNRGFTWGFSSVWDRAPGSLTSCICWQKSNGRVARACSGDYGVGKTPWFM